MRRLLAAPVALCLILLVCLAAGVTPALAAPGDYLQLADTHATPGLAWGVTVAGDVAYVADNAAGLHTFDVSDPADLGLLDSFDTTGNAEAVAVAGGVAYVADFGEGLVALDVSNPAGITLLDTYDTTGTAHGVAVVGDVVYLADGGSGLRTFDASDPTDLTLLDTYDSAASAEDVAVAGDVAYVADNALGLHAFDVSDPADLGLLDSYDTSGIAYGVALAGDVAYVADQASGLHAFDISDPSDLGLLDTYDTAGFALGVAVERNVACVADGDSGLAAIDVSDPTDLGLIDTYDTPGSAYGVAVAGRVAYVADWNGGLHSFTMGPVLPADPRPTRVAAATRYSTAVQIARKGFDPSGTKSWAGVTDIILASGEDRAAADPLSASGLCWAYDAPLFLTGSTSVPSEVKAAVKEIAAANGKVTVHIVGGPVSVPDARYTELASSVGAANLVKDRLRTTGDRYDMAATIATRVKAANGGMAPAAVLIANGADPDKFFDALALSPISASRGYPILLVSYSSVPAATKGALTSVGAGRTVIGGGPATVSDAVKSSLGAERWFGSDRYRTATTIANNAIGDGYLSDEVVGVAAKLPDALTGGSMVGYHGGVLLITQGDTLTPATGNWIGAHAGNIDHCYAFGGTKSLTPAVFTAIDNKLP